MADIPDYIKEDTQIADPEQESIRGLAQVSKDELNAVASRYGVDTETLSDLLPLFGGSLEGKQDNSIITTGLGLASDILGGLPTLLSKQVIPENTKAAIGDLQQLISERKSGARTALEIGASILTGGAGIKVLTKAPSIIGAGARAFQAAPAVAQLAAGGLVSGAIGSAAQARSGEEVQKAVEGAYTGAAAGAALGGLGSLVGLGYRAVSSAIKGKPIDPLAAYSAISKAAGEDLSNYAAKQREPLKQLEDTELSVIKKILTSKPGEAFSVTPEETTVLNKLSGDNIKSSQDLQEHILDLGKQMFKAAGGTIGDKSKTMMLEELKEKVFNEGYDSIDDLYNTAKDIQALSGIKGSVIKAIHGLWRYLGGRQYLEDVDNKFHTRLTPAIDKASDGIKLADEYGTIFKKELEGVEKKFASSKLDKSDAFDYLNAKSKAYWNKPITQTELNTIQTIERDPNKLAAIAEYQKLTRNMKEAIEDTTSLRIRDYGPFYVPNKVKNIEDYILAVKQKASSLGVPEGSKVDDILYNKLANSDDGKDLIKAIEMGTGTKISSSSQFNSFLNDLYNPDSNFVRSFVDASALHRRTGDIPDFVLNKDAIGNANNWINTVGRHAYLRPALLELNKQKLMLEKLGNKGDAEWIRGAISNLSGGREVSDAFKTVANEIGRIKLNTRIKLRELEKASTNPVAKEFYRDAYHAGNIVNKMMEVMHNNILATASRALINNWIQPLTTTIPELASAKSGIDAAKTGVFGASKIFSGFSKELPITNPIFARKIGKKVGDLHKPSGVKEYLDMRGYAVDKDRGLFASQFDEGIKDGIEKGALVKGFENLANASNITKGLYDVVETSNRLQIAVIGERLADRFMQRDPAIVNYVAKRAGAGYRAKFDELMNRVNNGDSKAADELRNTFGKFMVGKTAFNYDKASASQFAREFSPIITQFTKWPIEVSSDIVQNIFNKELKNREKVEYLGYKYFLPALIMLGAHRGAVMSGESEEDWYKNTIGKGSTGLASSAPITSPAGIVGGDIFTPPLPGIAIKTVGKIIQGKSDPTEIDAYKEFAKVIPFEWAYRWANLLTE